MPFKPKAPPLILKVESLSTGRAIRPTHYRDELNGGKLMPVQQDDSPVRKMKSGNELLNEIKQVKLDTQLNMLKALGLVEDNRPKPPPKPVAPNIPGMRPVGKLGTTRAIYIPLPPYRRW